VASGAIAALIGLAGCTAAEGTDQGGAAAGPTAQQAISPTKLAIANLLLADDIPAAPPGTVMQTTGPVTVKGVIGEPSRQVMTCTPLELPGLDDPGPAEPDAVGAASSNSVLGVAQVDQYAVVYVDQEAARRAVDRARKRAEECDTAFAVHSPESTAEADISSVPGAVDGFRVHSTYKSGEPGTMTDEISAVLRHGATVLYLRGNETGSGNNGGAGVDGALDPAWAAQLIQAAASHLAE
jgi:hypothetical protein